MQYLFQNRPDVRIDFAVYRYQNDHDLSLAKAAALAGVSFERMKDIVSSRGIPLRLGPETLEEAKAEVETMEHWFHERLD
jgi:predicted HTH domain antitoxin